MKVVKNEKFFTAIIFAVENKIPLVKHWQDELIKIPGGGFHPKNEIGLTALESAECYDNFDRVDICRKLVQAITIMLGTNKQFVADPIILEIAELLTDRYWKSSPIIHAIIEYIEEVGVIPIIVTHLYYDYANDIQKFYFVCEKAIAFNNAQKKFIDIITTADLPKKGVDYNLQDPDINKIFLWNKEKIIKNKERINRHHMPVIKNILKKMTTANLFKEKLWFFLAKIPNIRILVALW